jgi:hypothetical protein
MSDTPGDCDDGDPAICPSCPEYADDGIDSNCDSFDGTMCAEDADGDGLGSQVSEVFSPNDSCDDPGEATTSDDCDDGDLSIYPGAPETYDDGTDQDCNGFDTVTCAQDADEDGFGHLTATVLADDGDCTDVGESADATDCDDSASHVHPAAAEVCDGEDNDCDATTDEWGMIDLLGVRFNTISAAIDAAGTGDVIELCAGTYTETIVVDRSVSIVGLLGKEQTIIEPSTSGGPVVAVTGADVSLRGLTITGGVGVGSANYLQGGGGISAITATGFVLEESDIVGNSAEACGGLLLGEGAQLNNVVVSGNTAVADGGGLCVAGEAQLQAVSIFDNSAGGFGGGIYQSDSSVVITDSSVYRNNATNGGGASLALQSSLGSVNSSWGDGSDDNTPDDIYLESAGVSGSYGSSPVDFDCAGSDCI